MKADLRSAKGRPLLVETTQAGFGEGRALAPQSDWVAKRFGANPPATLPTLRADAAMSVLEACGVPPSLATDADGTSQRESWRRFIMGSVEPLLAIVRQELQEKLEAEIHFDLSNLWAHDLQGRASAFQKLVAGGVTVNEALTTLGITHGGLNHDLTLWNTVGGPYQHRESASSAIHLYQLPPVPLDRDKCNAARRAYYARKRREDPDSIARHTEYQRQYYHRRFATDPEFREKVRQRRRRGYDKLVATRGRGASA